MLYIPQPLFVWYEKLCKTYIHIIQVFQSKVPGTILSNDPSFVSKVALHKDFQLPTVTECIKKIAINFFNHINSVK